MQPLSKDQLKIEMKRFYLDKDRGISIKLFAELAGVNIEHFYDVFIYDKQPLTEYIQKRVNKAYREWKQGKVQVMRKITRETYVDYKKEPVLPMRKHLGLKVENGQIVINLGVKNRHDYANFDNILLKRG